MKTGKDELLPIVFLWALETSRAATQLQSCNATPALRSCCSSSFSTNIHFTSFLINIIFHLLHFVVVVIAYISQCGINKGISVLIYIRFGLHVLEDQERENINFFFFFTLHYTKAQHLLPCNQVTSLSLFFPHQQLHIHEKTLQCPTGSHTSRNISMKSWKWSRCLISTTTVDMWPRGHTLHVTVNAF